MARTKSAPMASTSWIPEPSRVNPGDRQFRGGIDTKGQFALNDKWVWGWDGVLLSDYYFMSDYRLAQYRDPLSSFLSLPTEAISQLYLTGVGNRSYFDARTIYYLSFSGNQDQVPVIHPVVDYSNVLNYPDLRRRVQLQDEFHQPDAATPPRSTRSPTLANTNGLCLTASADPTGAHAGQCLLRGMPGTYTRLTAEAQWRRSFTDSAGQIWTPFASVRADADRRLDLEPARRFQLPPGRRHPGAAGDADRRPRIPLSLHQCSALGHHDDRADRAGHHSSERILCRQASERRRAEHGVRRQQPVQRRQILGLRPRRRRRPRQCRRAGDHAVRPRRLRQRAVRTVLPAVRPELVRGRRTSTNTGVDSGLQNTAIRLRRPRQLFAEPDLYLQRPRPAWTKRR